MLSNLGLLTDRLEREIPKSLLENLRPPWTALAYAERLYREGIGTPEVIATAQVLTDFLVKTYPVEVDDDDEPLSDTSQ